MKSKKQLSKNKWKKIKKTHTRRNKKRHGGFWKSKKVAPFGEKPNPSIFERLTRRNSVAPLIQQPHSTNNRVMPIDNTIPVTCIYARPGSPENFKIFKKLFNTNQTPVATQVNTPIAQILENLLQDIDEQNIVNCKDVEKQVYDILTENYINYLNDTLDEINNRLWSYDKEEYKQIFINPPLENSDYISNIINIFGFYNNLIAYHKSIIKKYIKQKHDFGIDKTTFAFNINKIYFYGNKITELLEKVLNLNIDKKYTLCFKGIYLSDDVSFNDTFNWFKDFIKLNNNAISQYYSFTDRFEIYEIVEILCNKIIDYCKKFNVFINDYAERHPVS